ncbi:hypothetical protein Acr_24g0012480 [Actinidia rufa]|uniref:Uncharacterized protein n=1 Tax=Actinidia rufa TaxID=165716 RepID=A0A7J0GWA9_9ERIC|nr:hypothetical protein Acr_24g0012480 [Actinidia rufa]
MGSQNIFSNLSIQILKRENELKKIPKPNVKEFILYHHHLPLASNSLFSLSYLSLSSKVSEPEVRIDFVLGSKCRTNVRLRSLSGTSPVAFKVSKPHRPTSSWSTHRVDSSHPCPTPHSKSSSSPNPNSPQTFPRSPSDRFAPERSPNTPESNHPESIINSWFNHRESTHDIKLKVAFIRPFLLRDAVTNGDLDAVGNIIKWQGSILPELPTREAARCLSELWLS